MSASKSITIVRHDRLATAVALTVAGVVSTAVAAPPVITTPSPILVNEFNAVGAQKYIDGNEYGQSDKADTYFRTIPGIDHNDGLNGRIQGNGGDWIEFVVVQDNFDLRGWEIRMAEQANSNTNGADLWHDAYWGEGTVGPGRDGTQIEQSVIKFSNDAVWSNLRQGTIITVSEDAIIGVDTRPSTTPGLDLPGRAGNRNFTSDQITDGENDVPLPGGYVPDTFIDLQTDTKFDPQNNDWTVHVSTKDEAGKQAPLVSTTTNILNNNGQTKGNGNFDVGNDDFQVLLFDGSGNAVFGPVGERGASYSNIGWAGSGINSNELGKLEQTPRYGITADNGAYTDGESSTFGLPNVWSSGAFTQNFGPVREYWTNRMIGDADVDGDVDATDFFTWQQNFGALANSDWFMSDFDNDDDIDAADFFGWQQNFGYGLTSGDSLSFRTFESYGTTYELALAGVAAAVPEPVTAGLLAFIGVVFAGRRRRR